MSLDPWRYRCIDCGSTQLNHRHSYGKTGYRGNQAKSRYQCNECGSHRNQRKDMKTGKVVA